MRFHEGYVLIDHRASPGTSQVPEGTIFEGATMHCAHCNDVTIKNPNRTRERASCLKCGNMYVCDVCALEMKQPNYIHKSYQQRINEIYNNLQKVNNG